MFRDLHRTAMEGFHGPSFRRLHGSVDEGSMRKSGP